MPRPNTSKTNHAVRFSAEAWALGLLLVASIGPVLLGQAPAAPARVPFTQAQASTGSQVYTQKCASCHGARLDDGAAPPLSGARFLQKWTAAGRTVSDLFFIIQSTMPKNEGGTLSSSEYVSVLAHVLARNGYTAGDRELSADRDALSALRLTAPAAAA